jgi:DNA-directed RNA polymerases I, II, and III subunit RPABC2
MPYLCSGYDEEAEPEVYEDDGEDGEGQEEPDETIDHNNIVESGDPSAAAAAKAEAKNTVAALKSKKVPDELRSTTPYLTKYEKARILGTRALQIRCVYWENGICVEEQGSS